MGMAGMQDTSSRRTQSEMLISMTVMSGSFGAEVLEDLLELAARS